MFFFGVFLKGAKKRITGKSSFSWAGRFSGIDGRVNGWQVLQGVDFFLGMGIFYAFT